MILGQVHLFFASNVNEIMHVHEMVFPHKGREIRNLAFSGRVVAGRFSLSAAPDSPIAALNDSCEVQRKLTPYPRGKETASETASLISRLAASSASADRHLYA